MCQQAHAPTARVAQAALAAPGGVGAGHPARIAALAYELTRADVEALVEPGTGTAAPAPGAPVANAAAVAAPSAVAGATATDDVVTAPEEGPG